MACPNCKAESSVHEIYDEAEGIPALECTECGHVFGYAPF